MMITSEPSEAREDRIDPIEESEQYEGLLNRLEVKLSRTPVLLRLFLEYWVQL